MTGYLPPEEPQDYDSPGGVFLGIAWAIAIEAAVVVVALLLW